jgi:ABC-type branched-subunit amino acid transport system ATPase component
MSDSIIKVENLVKRFGTLTAVDSISFTVPAGEIFGFLGPNGAGKTTTISILCTLLKPTSGTAILNSYDVVRQQNQVSQSIGLVFQDPSLDDRLTGMQNMRFHAMVYNVPSSVREQRIEEVLKMVELWDREFGFLKEVLVAPISRASVSIGKTLGTATIALVQGMLILILAPLIGVSLSVTMVLALIPLMILLSVAMGSFGILLATRIKSMEAF